MPFGNGASDINWPVDIEPLCSQEGAAATITTEPERFNDAIVPLSVTDRTKARAAYDNIALAVAAYEGSKEISQFTSKFDYSLIGKATLNGRAAGKCGMEYHTKEEN